MTKIIMPPARMFSFLSIPSSSIRKQSNPAGTSGSMDALYCCACAENTPKPSSARKTPARAIHRPIMTRRLKNPPWLRLRRARADCEVDFFFIGGVWAEIWFFVHFVPSSALGHVETNYAHPLPLRFLLKNGERPPRLFANLQNPGCMILLLFLLADYVRCSWPYSAASI